MIHEESTEKIIAETFFDKTIKHSHKYCKILQQFSFKILVWWYIKRSYECDPDIKQPEEDFKKKTRLHLGFQVTCKFDMYSALIKYSKIQRNNSIDKTVIHYMAAAARGPNKEIQQFDWFISGRIFRVLPAWGGG